MVNHMGRSLARSNAHFKRASARLPLGVSSNFRYWGDEQTLYVSKPFGCGQSLRDATTLRMGRMTCLGD